VQSPGGNTTFPGGFTFVGASTPPTAASLTPNSGPVTGGTKVTITGTGFSAATGVTFGGIAGSEFRIVSDTEIRVSTPAHAVGTVDVVIQSSSGSATVEDGFTYVAGHALPITGGSADIGRMLLTGGAILLLGLGLVVVELRRRALRKQ